MEYDYAPTESSNWTKAGQYEMNSPWNVIIHTVVSLQIGRNEVSIEFVADGMELRTSWAFKLMETGSAWNEQHMECDYLRSENSYWSKRGQYQASSVWNAITLLHTNWQFKLVGTKSVLN